MNKLRYGILGVLFLLCYFSHGQNKVNKLAISEVLHQISKTHAVTFNYQSNLLNHIAVSPVPNNLSLKAKINNLEKQTGFIFKKISPVVYVISKAIQLCGYLKSAELQQPLAGATVVSQFDQTITDENGYFKLEVQSENNSITIRHLGYKTINRVVKYFNLKDCATIPMLVEQQHMAPILIKTYLVKGIDVSQDWTTIIDYKRFSLLPGLIESDVLQTVQALPSILSIDETVSNINIRGGSNDQNLMLWDDIKLYQTGHFFGLISSINPLMTQTASVINNGTEASFSDGVSGTIHMKTDKELDRNFNGVFGLNFLNAELFSNIPISKKSSLQVAARKSLNNYIKTPTYHVYFNRITQDTEAENNAVRVTNSNQSFGFYDASFRWLYQASKKDYIRVNFILMNNNLSFNETANINNILETKESSVSQNSLAFGINYKRKWNANFQTTLSSYETDYKLQSINANVLANQVFLQENIVSETSIKLNNAYQRNQWLFNLGYQFTETGITNLNDIDLPRFVRRDEEVLREHAIFGQAWYKTKSNDFSIRAGLRANYLGEFEELIFEPRLSIRKSIGQHFKAQLLGEFKHQNTSQIINFQNDFLGIEKRRWQLSNNNNIPILKSKQASAGIIYNNNSWLLDAKIYFKTVTGITTQSQSFTTKYEFAKEKGRYDVFGLECLFRKTFRNLNTWLSYSYMNNTYTFNSLEDNQFPSNFNLTHAITLGSTYSTSHWKLSAGINYRTGKPTSIPKQENKILDNEINFDIANNENLQDYFRMDASAIYKFKISNSFNSEIGVSVWNILNKKNTINTYYRVNENNAVNSFYRYALDITTNAVIRIYF